MGQSASYNSNSGGGSAGSVPLQPQLAPYTDQAEQEAPPPAYEPPTDFFFPTAPQGKDQPLSPNALHSPSSRRSSVTSTSDAQAPLLGVQRTPTSSNRSYPSTQMQYPQDTGLTNQRAQNSSNKNIGGSCSLQSSQADPQVTAEQSLSEDLWSSCAEFFKFWCFHLPKAKIEVHQLQQRVSAAHARFDDEIRGIPRPRNTTDMTRYRRQVSEAKVRFDREMHAILGPPA
ncbi:hypothetical protein BX600DRAFT_516002 [Xylariales sp. PMI_506]|nr:hypothetical protein BX600DRAFT_516002 [Xylariales sp. PMI_506]